MTAMLWNYSGRPLVTVVSNGDDVEEKLFSFLGLPAGWHFGRGCAPSFAVVVRSMNVMNAFRALGAESIEVFPGVNGMVLVSAFGLGMSIDATVSHRETVDYVVEQNDHEIEAQENVSIYDLINKIRAEKWLANNSSDLCTLSITATKKVDSRLWLSKTQTEPVYRWSSNLALTSAE